MATQWYAYRKKNGKVNRYGNVPTTVDGHRFDSKKEAARYEVLKARQLAGVIHDLELQPAFCLQDAFERDGQRYRPITYRADFRYKTDDGSVIVEDVKSPATITPLYEVKKKWLLHDFKLFTFKEVFDVNE